MTGAETLVASLLATGVDTCFANPGTSEMHFLAALDNPAMRSVLCLFEGCATGAADGFYRMADRPACTLLHLGPGLANGLANLHNARRASSGVVNVVGDHAARHLRYDAPLTSDIEGLARPLSHWVRRAEAGESLPHDVVSAVAAASSRPGQVATLILPGDISWGPSASAAPPVIAKPILPRPNEERIRHIAEVLRRGEPTLMVVAGRALRADALELAGRIAAKTGCRLACQFFSARTERGAGRTPVERIPYAVPAALTYLAGFKNIIAVETGEPIAFFSYPNQPSRLKPDSCALHDFVDTDEDSLAALEALVDELGANAAKPAVQARFSDAVPTGELNPASIALVLAAAIPDHAIVVDESLTTGREAFVLTAGAKPHDVLQNMGGSIGFSTPASIGAAIACPDRKVLCLVGDGSAMYTIQSLWTQARENLDVTTVVFANHAYKILKAEFGNMGAGNPGPRALSMMEIDKPRIDWQAMAKSMGVPSKKVEDCAGLHKALLDSQRETGPKLIEVCL